MISKEHIAELFWNMRYRKSLINQEGIERFRSLRMKYQDICGRFGSESKGAEPAKHGYEWREWAATVRRSFNKGVPLGFLSHPTLVTTMVLARRGGIKTTRLLLDLVLKVFGEETARRLLMEDYIGLPTIQDIPFMTSANRARLVNHLAHYSEASGKRLWECNSIVEWGGGFGSLGRILRRMNPSLTYTIIDLPELLSLQYIYLGSLEGEDRLNIISHDRSAKIMPGKINLVSSQDPVIRNLNWTTDGFISTWALTESPEAGQRFIMDREYFGAGNILLGFKRDENNLIAKMDRGPGLRAVPVPSSQGLGSGNEYWIR